MRQAICDRITSYLPTDYETLKQENSFPIGMNLQAPRGIVRVVLCLVLALVVFTTLEVAGIVAPRVFAILCCRAALQTETSGGLFSAIYRLLIPR
jgi:hypothetical protein